jgi:hypothetical protein
MRLCLGHPTEGYYTRDYTQGSASVGSSEATGDLNDFVAYEWMERGW